MFNWTKGVPLQGQSGNPDLQANAFDCPRGFWWARPKAQEAGHQSRDHVNLQWREDQTPQAAGHAAAGVDTRRNMQTTSSWMEDAGSMALYYLRMNHNMGTTWLRLSRGISHVPRELRG